MDIALVWLAIIQIMVCHGGATGLVGRALSSAGRQGWDGSTHRFDSRESKTPLSYLAQKLDKISASRGVAQPGRALSSGGRGREFNSRHPDQYFQ